MESGLNTEKKENVECGIFQYDKKREPEREPKIEYMFVFDGIQEIVFFFYCIKPTKNNVFQCYFDIYLGFLCLFFMQKFKHKEVDSYVKQRIIRENTC